MTALMFQGTASNVGKSTLVAGLCRALKNRGLRVLPFKPMNMSNNAAVTSCGGEIGRAQALQALACGVEPCVDMNPVLLKPIEDGTSQMIIRGRMIMEENKRKADYSRDDLLQIAIESFEILQQQSDIILIEGAGSAAEINLRERDITNMAFACATKTPVVMIGDIELGGVIASLVGSYFLFSLEERERVTGFIINKFRGDISLFEEGLDVIREKTRWPSIGVVPFMPCLTELPVEDAASLEKMSHTQEGDLIIAVPHLPHIANFDDLDPLRQETGVEVRLISPGEPLPSSAQLVLIPGTKATLHDLAFFKAQGWDIDLAAHVRRGGHVLGVCGGFQMLGSEVTDPQGIEGAGGTLKGLGLLDVHTNMSPEKQVGLVSATSHMMGCELKGYEIHIGTTTGPDMTSEFINSEDRILGASALNGQILGTYLHGLFVDDTFRRSFLQHLSENDPGRLNYTQKVDHLLDELADILEKHLDIDQLLFSGSKAI